MNGSPRLIIGFILVFIFGVSPGPDVFTAQQRRIQKMEFQDFVAQMKGIESFDIAIEGKRAASYYTGKKYVHYETVAFFGADDIKATRRILYHTEEDITVRYKNITVTAGYRRIRTSLAPTFEKTYTRDDLVSPGTDGEKALLGILEEEKVPAVLLSEFGLEPGKKYYGHIKTESYHLPPRGPGAKPERRENRVLVISDRPLPNDTGLTPLYQGWSY
jgi:hypothetical protein